MISPNPTKNKTQTTCHSCDNKILKSHTSHNALNNDSPIQICKVCFSLSELFKTETININKEIVEQMSLTTGIMERQDNLIQTMIENTRTDEKRILSLINEQKQNYFLATIISIAFVTLSIGSHFLI